MMDKIFFRVLNMSLVSGYVIALILLLRPLFGRISKRFSYALWGVALFRLLCPFSIGSLASLVPVQPNTVSTRMLYEQTPQIHSGIASFDSAVNRFLPAGTPQYSANPLQIHAFIAEILWISGMVLLAGYGIVSLFILMYQLRKAEAVPGLNRIYQLEGLETPFVLGIIRPKIYLPTALSGKEQEYVLLHETTHIKRLDHAARLAAYAALCIHWFNPLVWIAFWLSGKDMELSCDEKAVRSMTLEDRKGYSTALLKLSTEKRIKCPTPLAFGEGDVKGRIKSILSYRKPVIWVSVLALAATAVLCLGLAVNPENPLSDGEKYLEKLEDSFSIAPDGVVSLKVPRGMPAGSHLHIHVSGRFILEDGSGMSLHGFEDVEEWVPGKYYEDRIFDQSPYGWRIEFDAFLEDENGVQIAEKSTAYSAMPVPPETEQVDQMIFAAGKLYIATYEDVSKMVAEEAAVSEYDSPYIGEIVSSVGEHYAPMEELQSNFGCEGSEVVFNGSGVAVNIDGKWMRFEPVD